MKQVTICVDQDEIQLALTLLVDPEVFTEELAELINKLAGNEAGVEFEPHPGQDVVHRWPRIDALTTATGWRPRVGPEDGLRRTVGFWQQ